MVFVLTQTYKVRQAEGKTLYEQAFGEDEKERQREFVGWI
jgi:hypothetical protein